jgi:hypothetical protein
MGSANIRTIRANGRWRAPVRPYGGNASSIGRCDGAFMARRVWNPPDSVKLLLIIVAVPPLVLFGLLNLLVLFARLGLFRLHRLLFGR